MSWPMLRPEVLSDAPFLLISLQELRRRLSSLPRPFAILGRYSPQSFRVLGVISAPHAPLPSTLVENFLFKLFPSSPVFFSEIGGEELLKADDVIGRRNVIVRDGGSNTVDVEWHAQLEQVHLLLGEP